MGAPSARDTGPINRTELFDEKTCLSTRSSRRACPFRDLDPLWVRAACLGSHQSGGGRIGSRERLAERIGGTGHTDRGREPSQPVLRQERDRRIAQDDAGATPPPTSL